MGSLVACNRLDTGREVFMILVGLIVFTLIVIVGGAFLRCWLDTKDCFGCKHWIEASPTFENPGGSEYCSQHMPEWRDCSGCYKKEMEAR